MQKISKKGFAPFQLILPGVLILIISGVVIMFGLNLINSFGAGFTAGSAEAYAKSNVTAGIGVVSNQFGNLGLVLVLVIVITALIGAAAYFMRR